MPKKLVDIEGVGATYAEKLQAAGINTTDDLLEYCRTPKGREEVAQKAEISGKLVLRWTNHCDLFRINGVGEEYADLLEAAGVDTVPELAQRNAGNLTEAMLAVNEEKNLTRQPPSETQVAGWIEQAQGMPRAIEY
jgi:predicted flap endonuclease-1-like 5' DNA nuclease